jgi:hypothetical protein
MPSSILPEALRSPMASLPSEENKPLFKTKDAKPDPPHDTLSKKREWQQIDDENPSPRIKKAKQHVPEATDSVAAENGLNTDIPKGVICHQCRRPVKKALTVQCTRMKRLVNGLIGRCSIRYCNRCLLNRYAERITKIMELGPVEEEDSSRHFSDAGYCWTCPSCRGICNCSVHRKRSGLEPTG